MTRFSRTLPIVFVALAPLAACSPAGMLIRSESPPGPVLVDGLLDEWDGRMIAVKDAPFSLGVLDDGENLYVALSSADPDFQRQLLRRGLILWFDAEGGDAKISGIRFPRGMMDLMPSSAGERSDRSREDGRGEAPAANLEEQLATLAFMSGESSSWSMDREALQSMALAATQEGGSFRYEVRVPLRRGPERSYSVGWVEDRKLSFAVEVPAPLVPGRDEGRPGGMGGGPPGGMGAAPPGGMGAAPPGGMGERPGGAGEKPEALVFWFRVEIGEIH